MAVPPTVAEVEAEIAVLKAALFDVTVSPMRFKTSKSEYELSRTARADIEAALEQKYRLLDVLDGYGGSTIRDC